MPRIKILVDQQLVRKMLSEGVKAYSIEKRLGVPKNTVLDIQNGISRPYFMRNVKIEKPKEGMCNKCGFKPIHHGFRYYA